ncbi:MAG: hypothetical protein IJ761_07630 [Bacteroidales bacterium]|nr:hypothetical protein [Bacteroidales bacterium]
MKRDKLNIAKHWHAIRMLLACLGVWLGGTTVEAQNVWFEGSDTIDLGGQTSFVMMADSLAEATIASLTAPIEVLDIVFDSVAHTVAATITCFEQGAHWVHLPSGDSVPLMVRDVDVDTTGADLRDIAPVMTAPYTFWEVFRWVLLVALIAAVAWGVVYLIRHRKKVLPMLGKQEPVDTRTPYERATDSIEQLRREQLWQSGQIKAYHTRLTDAVRLFVEQSTSVNATDLTSEETLDALKEMGFEAECEPLHALFVLADMVKFAKEQPLPHQHDQAMTWALQFVEVLWQRVKPMEEEKKEASNE